MLEVSAMKFTKQSGFSLVELLVAMVVGLVVVGGAFSLHSATRVTQLSNEMHMDMVADARFAIEQISYDLRHAGMWGGTNKAGLIECKSTDTACTQTSNKDTPPSSVAAVNDCAAGWYYDLSNPIFATDGSAANPYSGSCIPGSEEQLSGTDLLEVRYADSNIAASLQANQVYVRSNFINGRIFVGDVTPLLTSYDSSTLTNNHELRAYVYYVSAYTDATGDGIPSLRRVALVNGPAMQNQTLISGVEEFQIQFGVDANADQTVDRYVDPSGVTDWSSVYAAKIWLLMRSDKNQVGIDTTKSFSIAGAAAKEYGGKDGFRYFLVTSVVDLRNMKSL
jgi:type IV pilus assembly protein PilW